MSTWLLTHFCPAHPSKNGHPGMKWEGYARNTLSWLGYRNSCFWPGTRKHSQEMILPNLRCLRINAICRTRQGQRSAHSPKVRFITRGLVGISAISYCKDLPRSIGTYRTSFPRSAMGASCHKLGNAGEPQSDGRGWDLVWSLEVLLRACKWIAVNAWGLELRHAHSLAYTLAAESTAH